jgi:hypothetical protein
MPVDPHKQTLIFVILFNGRINEHYKKLGKGKFGH